MVPVSRSVLAELPISNKNLGQSEKCAGFLSKPNPKSAAQLQGAWQGPGEKLLRDCFIHRTLEKPPERGNKQDLSRSS